MNENPNPQEFLKNTQALHVINGMCPNITRGSTEQQAIDTTPLHKRSRPKKSLDSSKLKYNASPLQSIATNQFTRSNFYFVICTSILL